jgi:hypothetical protein
MVVVAAVPVFPGRGRVQAGRAAVWGGPRGRAGEHARDVWDREREGMARRAGGIEKAVGRDMLTGAVELEFLVGLAKHCLECPREGCGAWSAWGIGQVPGLRELFGSLGGTWQQVPPGYARALAAVVREG